MRIKGAASIRRGHDEIVAVLGSEILSGARPPGSRLPSAVELFDRFGVSRNMLREVTKTLAAKGMVVAKTKVGTRVLPREHWNWFDPEVLRWRAELGLDLNFVRELTELRRAVEPLAAALAAQRRTCTHLTDLRRALTAMSSAGTDARAFAYADLEFHIVVASASGNSLFQSFASVIETALSAYFSLSTPIELEDRAEIIRGHEKIAGAIKARNVAGAERAMIAVIDKGLDRASRGARDRAGR